MNNQLLYLRDQSGKLMAVQVPAHIWEQIAPLAAAFTQTQGDLKESSTEPAHDLAAFNELMAVWTFRYPYDASVHCPNCQSKTSDWRSGNDFTLLNANIGGLMVFRCNNCKGTVRQKFFKDHVACEFTPPAP